MRYLRVALATLGGSLSLIAIAPPASASPQSIATERYFNREVCMEVDSRSGGYYSVRAAFRSYMSDGPHWGYFHLWGPAWSSTAHPRNNLPISGPSGSQRTEWVTYASRAGPSSTAIEIDRTPLRADRHSTRGRSRQCGEGG